MFGALCPTLGERGSEAGVGSSAGRLAWPKYAFFAVVAAMAAFVLWNNERFLIDPASPNWPHYKLMGWRLVVHGLAGVTALALGALQFSSRLRRTRLGLHRLIGKTYVASVFIAAPAAIFMAIVVSPWFMLTFTITQAGVWMLCTALAYMFVRRRDVASHREWMIRSYAIVLNFLEGRVLMAVPPIGAQGMDAVVAVNWLCLALTLVGAELVIQSPKLSKRGPAASVRAPGA
jgi:uncharacterized membrane protein